MFFMALDLPYLSITELLQGKKLRILRTCKNWDSSSACENSMNRNGHSRRTIHLLCILPSSSQTEVAQRSCNPGAGEVEASHESEASQGSRHLSGKKPIDVLFYFCGYDISNTIYRVHYSIYDICHTIYRVHYSIHVDDICNTI